MEYIVKGLDFNNILPELKAQVDQLIKSVGGELKALDTLVKDLTGTIIKGHEQTQQALQIPAKYRAFVESLTAEDLREEDITEESIRDFLSSSIEEKTETVELLDLFTVYRLYEKKDAERAIKVPTTATAEGTGYKGLEQLKRELLHKLKEQSTFHSTSSLQGIKPLKKSNLTEIMNRQDKTQSIYKC